MAAGCGRQPETGRLQEKGRGEHEADRDEPDGGDGEQVGADVAVIFADVVSRGRVVTAGAGIVSSLDVGSILARFDRRFSAFGTGEGGGGGDAAPRAARLSSGHMAMLFRGG